MGIEPVDYAYYDPKTIGLDFEGFISSLKSAPESSAFLLHACAHNPTGVDPTAEQWEKLADVFIEKKHFAFFDCAYQGFASGDLDRDASAVRYFVQRGIPMLVCQVCSFPIQVLVCLESNDMPTTFPFRALLKMPAFMENVSALCTLLESISLLQIGSEVKFRSYNEVRSVTPLHMVPAS